MLNKPRSRGAIECGVGILPGSSILPRAGLRIEFGPAAGGVNAASFMLEEGAPLLLALWIPAGTVPDTVGGFLEEPDAGVGGREPVAGDALRAVLFTDVEGSTALMRRLGDRKARRVLRAHDRIVLHQLKAYCALSVKPLGDGHMASFSSTTRALECAIAIQKAFAEYNQAAEQDIKVRIGLNVGEAIVEQRDIFGAAVNLAARIAAKAKGGEILVSDVVRQLAVGRRFLFKDRGEVALRGFKDPVRLFEVTWEA